MLAVCVGYPPAAHMAAVCSPNPPPYPCPLFNVPPLEKVAAGIPAALPKPFNVVFPDKNISPSVKIAAVGGGNPNSSVFDFTPLSSPPATNPSVLVVPRPPLLAPFLAVDKSAVSVHDVPSQEALFAELAVS